MKDVACRDELQESVVETFDIFAGVNQRFAELFDPGRVKVALIAHYLFSEAGHLCGEETGCGDVIHGYYERIRPSDADPGRAQRIDRLFDGILRADDARERIRRVDYPGRSRIR